jgi:cytochrome oxidase Cu insertion factor (SCO1/SenC/PrrC family)
MGTRWGWLSLAVLFLAACQAASATGPSAASAPASTGASAGPAAAAAPASAAQPRELRVGDRAPDFTLQDQNRQEVRLSQFRGRPVQVAFYVWAFSPS